MNVSISSIPEDGSNEKLMSIIKYLRKDKDIVTGRLEVKEAALATSIRQLEHARKQAEDVHNAMEIERQERDSNLMTAGKHAELLRKVESLASLTDSNKLLREEKNKLETIVNSAQEEAQQAKEKIRPLENKIRDLEEKCSTLLIEKTGLVSETEEWKKRSDQLVEKSFKMNPEELKRLQDAEIKLTKQINLMNADKQKAIQQANTVTKELNNLKQSLGNTQEELKTVVTLFIAIDGDSTKLPQINSISDLEKALTRLATDVKVDDCLRSAEILWTPDDQNDVLSEREVVADYPKLRSV